MNLYMGTEDNSKSLILIVDDNPRNIQILTHMLKKEGFKIAIAMDGIQAIGVLEETHPDLILLDVMMPKMDGYETCEKIKADPQTKEIPVIFLSAKSQTEDIVKGLEVGGVDYVTKPFNAVELLARVRTQVELKKAKDELKEKNKKLKELDKVKNEFLGMAAHDLRNPIGAIRMFSSLMLEEMSDTCREAHADFLIEIKSLSIFMLNLLTDLLDISAIDAGKLKLRKKKENYLDFLKYNIRCNKYLADKKGIKLNFNFDDNIPGISFDKNKLMQVMNNLISNAIKFSHKETEITVDVERKGNNILTVVTDQGQGIPQDELEHIFKPFHKSSVRSTGGERSTGLGLAITEKMVRGHGGVIGVESEEGKGSSFYFTLPVS